MIRIESIIVKLYRLDAAGGDGDADSSRKSGALLWSRYLLDGYGLSQVARLVDIAAPAHGDVVSQQL